MRTRASEYWRSGKGFYSGFEFKQWGDGNQIWTSSRDCGNDATIERLIANNEADTVRRDWHIVKRAGNGDSKYPPILAGPFENIKVALVAFNLLYNQGERP